MIRKIRRLDFRVWFVFVIFVGACSYELPAIDWTKATGGSGGAGAGETGSASSGSIASGGLAGGAGGNPSSSGVASSGNGTTGSSSSGAVVPPEFVQIAYDTPQTPQVFARAVYQGAQTAGNTNILAIGWNDTTSVLKTVTDSAGNKYQQAVGVSASATMSQTIYYASNIVYAVAGTNAVTVTFGSQADYIDLRIVEYSGLGFTNPVGASTTQSGTGVFAKTGSITTTVPHTLLFSAGMTRGSFAGPGAGYSLRVITNPDSDIVQDRIAAVPTSAAATADLSDSEWLLQLVAFQPAP